VGIDENAAFGDFGPPIDPKRQEKGFLYTPMPKLIGLLPIFILSIFFTSLTSFHNNIIFLGSVFVILYLSYLKIIDWIRNAHLRHQVEQGLNTFYKEQT
jgi:hypothetical protein